jgi:hypothetical protein
LPPAELAVHPADNNFVQRDAEHELLGAVLYLIVRRDFQSDGIIEG